MVVRSDLTCSNTIGEEVTTCPSGTDAIYMVFRAREAMGLRPARPQARLSALTPTLRQVPGAHTPLPPVSAGTPLSVAQPQRS